MKGQLSLPIIGIILTLVIVIGILVPVKFLTTPLVHVIRYEEKHNNAQMILISLLSSTDNKKTIQEIIGEYLILGEPDGDYMEKLLKKRLDKLVESRCYKLSTSSEKLSVKSSKLFCNPEKYTKETEIALPYNSGQLTEKLILVIN